MLLVCMVTVLMNTIVPAQSTGSGENISPVPYFPPGQGANLSVSISDFTLIGTTTAENQSETLGIAATKATKYFLSTNSAEWFSALSDCRKFFGENASLVCIETRAELDDVQRFLNETDTTVGDFWTGGKYDSDRGTFFWLTGAEIADWAPWQLGHPDSRFTTTRVIGSNVGKLKYRTQLQTATSRYLCELNTLGTPSPPPPNDTAIACQSKSNLIIVVDGSGSVGVNNFKLSLNFTANLVSGWMTTYGSRTSVITFSTRTRTLYTLGMSSTLGESRIREIIQNALYSQGSTASHRALHQVIKEFRLQNQISMAAPNIMLFITDGISDNPDSTKAAARQVNQAGIHSISLGIGQNPNLNELIAIAGGDRSRVFKTDKFQDLRQLLRDVSIKLCVN